MRQTYQNFLKTGIDLSPLGVEPPGDSIPYFCTPRGARIFGRAGVDGIHYCFIRGFGEMVFAVSPMNPAPEYVHPLAANFSDFLRLLLACGDCGALEQAWQWDAGQFAAFLAANPPTPSQQTLLARLARQTGLSPMEAPWQYLADLRAGFDFGKLRYSEDFYDPDMNPSAPTPAPAWKVTFSGGFFGSGRERPGREIRLNREFVWGGRSFRIPAVYSCGKGLVLDICLRAEPEALHAFCKKWENVSSPSQEQQAQLDLENPLEADFRAALELNRHPISCSHSRGICWLPWLPAQERGQAGLAVDHYGLDPAAGWAIQRFFFPWTGRRRPEIRTLAVTLSQNPRPHPGPHFQICQPGDRFAFRCQGQDYTFTVLEYQAQTADWSRLARPGAEYPSHYMAMTYSLSPEPPDGLVAVADCDDGDRPRQPPAPPDQPQASDGVAMMGVIGGSDGPTALFVSPPASRAHAVCSSLHFEPPRQVEWRLVFYEKSAGDFTLSLLG